jgi:hypothetical protein
MHRSALGGELEHLRSLSHRFRQLELAGVDPRHVLVPPCPRRRPPVGRRSERLQMHIADARLLERAAKRRLGEPGPARQRQGANIDDAFHSRPLKRGDELGHGGALIANGEDAHPRHAELRRDVCASEN